MIRGLRKQKEDAPKLEIYLVRHGQTEFNRDGRLQGWCDSPLTEAGKAGSATLGKRMAAQNVKFDAAFSSTSGRAVDTAKIILQNSGQPELPIIELEELREYHFGAFEGQSSDELNQYIAEERGYPDTAAWLEAYRNGSYNMLMSAVSQLDPARTAEDETDFLSRLRIGLFHVIGECPNDRDARVLIVTHGMSITTILKSIDPMSIQYRSVPNASVTRLRYDMYKGLEIIGIADGGLNWGKDRPPVAPISKVARGLGYRNR
ncbi:histidine phosphatase family protein [Wielerella bovis]|uniref:histidine phosphatase family protein n=1 Tax=Wielerella bovis TaxID=2917790 RepID=UPI0020184B40|nr:histidine phosphatase family protein [Wielerella bovis]ULJ62832.1 histidine phosphatase family protein [Wielerella bovis]ULJ69638.1 histidine phosphatase family protein [Wielerella bovis]